MAEHTKPDTYVTSYVHQYNTVLDYVFYEFNTFTCAITPCINERCVISNYKLFQSNGVTEYTAADGLEI